MLPVTLASAEAKASSPPCAGSLPQSFSTIDGFSWPIDITAAFARCAMSRIELPDLPETRSTGLLSTGFIAGAIAICTEAEALCFFTGSAGSATSTDGEAEASCTPAAGAGATLSGEAAANRSLNITAGTAATVSFFGAEAVACDKSPNALVMTAAGVLRTIELVAGVANGT